MYGPKGDTRCAGRTRLSMRIYPSAGLNSEGVHSSMATTQHAGTHMRARGIHTHACMRVRARTSVGTGSYAPSHHSMDIF